MNPIIAYYQKMFTERGFLPDPENHTYGEIGSTWRLTDSLGGGIFWLYAQKDLFSIKIHDFYFHQDRVLEFNWPECLGITQYFSIAGEELSPYRRLEAGCVKSFIGGYKPYKVLIHKKIPIRCIGIEIMPAYYEDYLKKKFPGEYDSPQEAFASVGQTMNFPEMSQLLKLVWEHRGQGMATKLFYEGKVAEAIALIVERNKKSKERRANKQRFSPQDIEQLETITRFLNDHYAQNVTLEQLGKIACMGKTKLQTSFKQYNCCTITEYLQQRRMSQAEYLLSDTDLNIGQIAKTVGYTSASRFAELFRKSTGLLPGEFRKIAQNR